MGLHEDTHSFWLPISLSCLSTSTSLLSLLEEFDGPSLERLLPHALQTLCTKNSSALSEIPRSLAICVLVFPLVSNRFAACGLNSFV